MRFRRVYDTDLETDLEFYVRVGGRSKMIYGRTWVKSVFFLGSVRPKIENKKSKRPLAKSLSNLAKFQHGRKIFTDGLGLQSHSNK